MLLTTIAIITGFSAWITFMFGLFFNLILIHFIIKHTPNQMKVYSRILLQTCFTDLLLLVSSLITDPIGFETSEGIGVYNNGLLHFQSPENKFWNSFLYISWVYLSYVSLFGFVAQFIYRYLILNWDKRPSMAVYLLILIGVLSVPTVYIIMFALSYYPSDEHLFLEDQNVREILFGQNNTDRIILAGFAPPGVLLFYGAYYILMCCTIAYLAICLLGWLMHRRVKNSQTGIIGLQQQKMKEMNRQITKTLSIQAALPSTIYLPLVFTLGTLALGFSTAGGSLDALLLQYYYMLFVVPMFFPPAINPAIAIATIPAYRRAFLDAFHNAFGKRESQSAVVDLATREIVPNSQAFSGLNPLHQGPIRPISRIV